MKLLTGLLICLLSCVASAQIDLVVLPASERSQVTIYNSADLTLVRDTRRLTLKKGVNLLQFGWSNTQIDPTSISIRPLAHAGDIEVQFLSYPARTRQVGQWQIDSDIEGAVPFEITYFASGLSWRAFYMGTMNDDETTMSLKGYVNVSNFSGQDLANTETRVIVGQTRLIETINFLAGRQYPYGPDFSKYKEGITTRGVVTENGKIPLLGDLPMVGGLFRETDGDGLDAYGYGGAAYFKAEIKQIEKKGLSEYFLYTIEGTENLKNQWTRRLPSFDASDIPIESLYKYDEDRYGSQTVRFVSFANDAEHELGETPIPEGMIKIYRNLNAQQNLAYVGGSDFKYIPVNEDVELNLGASQLVKVEPLLMNLRTDNYVFDTKGNIAGWDDIVTWQMKVTNTRDIPAEIEITRNFHTNAWELVYVDAASRAQDSITYKKHDKTRGRFTLTVPPRSEKTFGYTVTQYRGTREEVYVKEQQKKEPSISRIAAD